MFGKRTDLAVEAHEICQNDKKGENVDGVFVTKEEKNSIHVTRVKVEKEGVEAMGKPEGMYITLEMPVPPFYENDTFSDAVDIFTEELSSLIKIPENETVLVAGLGNRLITADALGPKVAENTVVTRHLFDTMPEELEKGVRPVCAVSPGVLGVTGIETGEIIRGIADRVKPSLIIAVDALASRKMKRVNSTIQLSDTGITPGSGIGNTRMGINYETLNIPVIAVGVPTVVDAATMANDTIDMVIDYLLNSSDGKFYEMLKGLDRDEKYSLITSVLNNEKGNFIVAPKDADEVVFEIAEIISTGINRALHKNINKNNANKYR